MRDALFHLDRKENVSIQSQIREMLVNAVLSGHLAQGTALPSCRKMSKILSVSRNTVVLAYQGLVDDGYLMARERSGFYVSTEILSGHVESAGRSFVTKKNTSASNMDWANRLRDHSGQLKVVMRPKNWRDYPYPFIYGQPDPSLFPIAAWRECTRQALSKTAMEAWTADPYGEDDPELISQIRTRLLPRRGINASEDEVLITLGAQNALYLLAEMLVDKGDVVGFDDPGYPDARNIFSRRTDKIKYFSVDEKGMPVDDRLNDCNLVFITPSHQSPTTVTFPLDRRNALLQKAQDEDFLIIEDDYEYETNYVSEPTPALKSLDVNDRVIYVGSLSKSMFPGLRMGYIVAPKELIVQLRALRRFMYRNAPSNNQRTTALFLGLGHHDTLVHRLQRIYRTRWELMRDALDRHMPGSSEAPSFGGTSYWVKGPDGLDATKLADDLLAKGVIIEPGEVLFVDKKCPKNFFRLGFSSIAEEKIEEGVRLISEEINNQLG